MIEAVKSVVRGALPASIYGPIRARRVRRLIDGFEPRMVEREYAGFRLRVMLEDPLAEGWYDRDWEEPPEITELRKGRLCTGASVFDLGAHQGVVALILARIVGDEGRVVAVEAEPHNAAVAGRNARANEAGNVTVLHAVAGAESGVLSFSEGLNGTVARAGAPGAIEVASLTVDELAVRYGRPDVVLVDVEGYEAHVLTGARATIAAGSTDFFVELHSAETLAVASSTADDVLDHFARAGYDVVVAVADESAHGPDDVASPVWRDASAMVHRQGQRCFVVARPGGNDLIHE